MVSRTPVPNFDGTMDCGISLPAEPFHSIIMLSVLRESLALPTSLTKWVENATTNLILFIPDHTEFKFNVCMPDFRIMSNSGEFSTFSSHFLIHKKIKFLD